MITVAMVLDAYKKTGFKPCRLTFFALPEACCPIAAIAYLHDCCMETVADLEKIGAVLGVSVNYLWGFARGFDGVTVFDDQEGYKDGEAAYLALSDVKERP